MNCIVCNTVDARNRVVYDHRLAEYTGSLCTNCERLIFGTCLDKYEKHSLWECLVCQSQASITLEPWEAAEPEQQGPDPTEITILESTHAPPLCRTHFLVLCSNTVEW